MCQTLQCLYLVIFFTTYYQIFCYYLLVKLQDGPEDEDTEGKLCKPCAFNPNYDHIASC